MDLPEQLQALLRVQDGLVTRRQLRGCGLSDDAVRWALGCRWRMVLPGVVAAFTGRLDEHQRLVAGALYAGEQAVLTGPAATRWHALSSVPRTEYLHFQVPSALSARAAGPVVVRRTTRPDQHAFWRPPLQVASPARAVADTARLLRTPDDVTALVLEAVQRGVSSVPALRHELEAGGRIRSGLLRQALRTAELGVWSLPESGLEAALAHSRSLPPLMANPELRAADGTRLPTPDGWLDDVGLALQVHSLRWHALGADWEGTVIRDSVFVEHGITVVAFTPQRISTDPAWVARRVETIHAALTGRGRPAVVAVPRAGLAVV